MAAVSRFFETIGRRTAQSLDEIGYGASLLGEALFWLLMGRRYRQPVRAQATMLSMLAFGVSALPIATLLSGTIGLMLAIQSLYSLGIFGAESFAYIGIAFGVATLFMIPHPLWMQVAAVAAPLLGGWIGLRLPLPRSPA